ncbi:hypothetical protein BDW02DRAFT_390556 [Decorospora gaudefroyi]|uniref:Uncharacterized protein n=1 Tax=Decorospora gaudefroyi TaxID=184978 RepID=A0A6A5KJI4_9PLEO|nr:hypothetical protein BDW02DRAFT_390556 [Decorospora gaudefroyi]
MRPNLASWARTHSYVTGAQYCQLSIHANAQRIDCHMSQDHSHGVPPRCLRFSTPSSENNWGSELLVLTSTASDCVLITRQSGFGRSVSAHHLLLRNLNLCGLPEAGILTSSLVPPFMASYTSCERVPNHRYRQAKETEYPMQQSIVPHGLSSQVPQETCGLEAPFQHAVHK